MRSSPQWRHLFALLLIAAAGWYLFAAIRSNWEGLRDYRWEVRPFLLGISVAAHIAVLAWGVWVWRRVLRHFEHPPVGIGSLLRIWFLSNLARYIPGKIFQFLAAAQLGRAAGIPAAVLLTSLLVHTGFALLTAALLAVWTLTHLHSPAVTTVWLAAGATAVALLLVHPSLLNHALAVVSRVARRNVIRWMGSWTDGLVLLLLSVLSWCFYGAAYYLFIAALTPVPLSSLPVLAGVNALSFVAGYLAIVTPGGLGVREAAMTGLLLPLLPGGVAAVVALASRLWTIAAEVLGGTAVLLLFRERSTAVQEQRSDAAL